LYTRFNDKIFDYASNIKAVDEFKGDKDDFMHGDPYLA